MSTKDKDEIILTRVNTKLVNKADGKEFAVVPIQLSNRFNLQPFEFEGARFTVEPMQLDILALIMQFINEDTDSIDNREYSISVELYQQIRGYETEEEALKELKHKVCGDMKGKCNTAMINNGFDITINDDCYIGYNLFSKIAYKNGVFTFTFNERAKTFLAAIKQSEVYGQVADKIKDFALAKHNDIDSKLAPIKQIADKKGLSYISFKPIVDERS